MSTSNTTDDGEPWVYHGFPESNTTPIPDEFFDIIAPKLTEAELRVSLYVMRRTRGFKKSEDAISFSQLVGGIKTRDGRVLDQGTGMSKSAVWRGVNGLVAKGILLKHTALSPLGDNETNVYRIHYRGDRGVVLQKNHPSSPKEPPVVLQENTQETGIQETVRHHTDTEDSPSFSSLPGFTHSEFRRARAQFVQEKRQEATAAPRPLTAPEEGPRPTPQSVTSGSAPSPGMTRISKVLQTKGVPPARGTNQARPASGGTAPIPNARASQSPPPTEGESRGVTATIPATDQPQRSKRLARPAASDPDYPNTITEDELAAQDAERQSQSGPPPVYIDHVMDDVATKLIKDLSEAASHRTQARNIWEASGLDVQAFVGILYDARDRVRPRRGVDNKMAYFFRIVRVLAGLDENPNPPESRPPAKGGRRSAGSTRQPANGEGRPSLAGKYAHLVRR